MDPAGTSCRTLIGSQSLRRIELERRREIGIAVDDPHIIAGVAAAFRRDWRRSAAT